jgi:hypothetical protein
MYGWAQNSYRRQPGLSVQLENNVLAWCRLYCSAASFYVIRPWILYGFQSKATWKQQLLKLCYDESPRYHSYNLLAIASKRASVSSAGRPR